MKVLRYSLWGLVAVCAFAVGALSIGMFRDNGSGAGPGGEAPYGAAFQLVDHNGAEITEAALRGRPTAIFFGFTHCPDVCPTTLYEMSQWADALGNKADEMGWYFVTVDPERDTPEQLKSYIGSFSEDILGVTGEPVAVREMLKAFNVYYRKVPTDDDDYTMDHLASVLLLNPDGSFSGTISFGEDSDTALAKLNRLAAQS